MIALNQNVHLKAQNEIQGHYMAILSKSFIAYSHGIEIAHD